MNAHDILTRQSFIELGARERAHALLDPGSFRELAGPFERLYSPWLMQQGITAQADDGVVAAKGLLAQQPTVVLAIEGAFQGGSMGEIAGAKIAGCLALALEDNHNGTPTGAIILFETGGVRLQEANLGLAAIAEIQAGIVALRRHRPVLGIIAGTVGCYGGMSIAAALCSELIVTREARLGLNGPAVIEQEAGIAEFDSRDKPMIWRLTGGEQRYRSGLADRLVADDATQVRDAAIACFARGTTPLCRSERVEQFRDSLAQIDPDTAVTPEQAVTIYGRRFAA